jgi:hypothetical protein
MSLDKFKSIIQEKGRFVPENELEIFQQYDLRTSFGLFQHDTIRVIIYDASNNPLPQANFGLVRYINKANQPEYYKQIDNIDKKKRKNYTVDVKKLIKDAGYNIGIFTVELMFVNNRLGTQNKPNRAYIQEISPSRTEVRVLPYNVGDARLNGLSLKEIIDERYDAFLYDEQFKEDIYEAIEPFLDLITVNDIKDLLINQVSQNVFNEIIKQYFKNKTSEFDIIINKMIYHFKDAVRYELLDKDSVIGTSYNVFNPNFGKDRQTTRVSIDFPTFCFNKLLESLEVYVPKLKDREVTQFVEELEEFPFPRIRPGITVPTQRDPNPATPTPTPTPTLPPGTTVTPTPTPTSPPIKYDRGQSKFKVSLYTNQPKNLLYTNEPVVFYGGSGPFPGLLFKGDFSLESFKVKQYDTFNKKYVPKDLNWIPKTFDKTTELGWDEYNKYLPEETQQLVSEFNFTDAERGYSPISLREPVIPVPGTRLDLGASFAVNNIVPNRTVDPTNNYPIPFYYYKKNEGQEKQIQIFKDNILEISVNSKNLTTTCSTMPLSSNQKFICDLQSNVSFISETENWIFDGYYDWDTGALLSNLLELKLEIKKDTNIFIKYRRTSIPIRGYWEFVGDEQVYCARLGSQSGTYPETRMEYIYATGLIQKDSAGVWRLSNTGQIGQDGLDGLPEFRSFEGLPQTIGDPRGEPSGIMSGLDRLRWKQIIWTPSPYAWMNRPEWQNLVKITDPTKGGVYEQPLLDNVKDFLKDKETFSRFEL